jgi:hypothetical protein
MLESLASIMEAKRHPQELPAVERSDDCSFLYVSRPNRYLKIAFLEVQFGEGSAVGCSDFHFFSYFWECLTFPLFLGTQEFKKCIKKNNFSSAVLSEFFWTFSKI